MVSRNVLIAAGVVGLLVVAVGAWFFLSTRPPALPPGAKDCGSDTECLKQALSGCSPARLTVSREGVSFLADVRGPAPGAAAVCLVFVKPLELNPTGLTPEQAQQLESVKAVALASDMTCKVPAEKAGSLDDPQFLMKPETLAGCEGSLKSFIELAFQRYGPSPTPA